MNKGDIVASIHVATGHDEQTIKSVIDSMLEMITARVMMGESVTLREFGVFSAKEFQARRFKDFRTGEVRLPNNAHPKVKLTLKPLLVWDGLTGERIEPS